MTGVVRPFLHPQVSESSDELLTKTTTENLVREQFLDCVGHLGRQCPEMGLLVIEVSCRWLEAG